MSNEKIILTDFGCFSGCLQLDLTSVKGTKNINIGDDCIEYTRIGNTCIKSADAIKYLKIYLSYF